MKKLVIILITVVLLLTAFGCAQSASVAPSTMTVPAPAPAKPGGITLTQVPAPTIVPAPTTVTQGKGEAVFDANQAAASDRMIVRTGNLALIVEDVASTIEQITRLTEDYGGYVVSSNSWKDGDRLVGTIAVRVPVERFTEAIAAFRNIAVDVQSETTSSKDVTEEYTDLTSRLKNLEAAEAQLVKLLEKAQKVEDILAIQRELTNTRGQIEQTKGRMQYLERTSSTSIIEIQLQQSELSVDFTANRSSVKAGEEIRFSGKIAGGFGPYSYFWDFGDGRTSTEAAPRYTYKSSGTYTVSLKVTDDRGNTDTEIREKYITVIPAWDIGAVFSSAWNGLVLFGRAVADIIIWVLIFSPVWLIGGGIFLFFWRRRRKKA
ncbi:MAG: DUF4349 domain-containing protein [Dehalococcoidales bacterium]|nr:DUF4349 domain-containing protein [Dehalococcoidales bacterium]